MELPMDHNPFMTVNMEEGGEDIYCQTALATAGISSSCQQSTHCWPPLNHHRCRGDISNITCRPLPSNQLQCSYKEAHHFPCLHAFTGDACVFKRVPTQKKLRVLQRPHFSFRLMIMEIWFIFNYIEDIRQLLWVTALACTARTKRRPCGLWLKENKKKTKKNSRIQKLA